MVSVVVLVYEVFEDVSIIIHDGRDHGCRNLCDRRIIVIEEGVFERHDIVADEVILTNDEEGGLWCRPDVPVEEQGALEIGYLPNVVGGDGLMLSVMGAREIRGDDEEVGGKEGVSQHLAEEGNFSGVDCAVIGWGERDDARPSLLFPEAKGGRQDRDGPG